MLLHTIQHIVTFILAQYSNWLWYGAKYYHPESRFYSLSPPNYSDTINSVYYAVWKSEACPRLLPMTSIGNWTPDLMVSRCASYVLTNRCLHAYNAELFVPMRTNRQFDSLTEKSKWAPAAGRRREHSWSGSWRSREGWAKWGTSSNQRTEGWTSSRVRAYTAQGLV